MWKFDAKYENYLGEPREKVLYFNLSENKLRKLAVSKEGGIDSYYQKLLDTNDSQKLYEAFEELVMLSYGEITADGEGFDQRPEIYEKFVDSPAYDVFMEYIFTSENGAANFISGILPKKYVNMLKSDEGKKIAAEHNIDISMINK